MPVAPTRFRSWGRSCDALSFFWWFLAGVGVVTFVILYVI